MKLWPELREGRMLEDILGSRTAARYWTKVFDRVHGNAIDTWDYQWTFASWVQNQLSILPASNLVSNAGFGGDATHTVAQGPLANLPLVPMQFPLSHPPAMIRDYAAGDFTLALGLS